jgi:succinate dehydrogenase / fumarate reductase flavoprotein subunit
MQGLADGYFVLPNTIRDYLAKGPYPKVDETHPAVVEARVGRGAHRASSRSTASAPSTPSTRSSATSCGSTAAWSAPRRACSRPSTKIRALRAEFWRNVKVLGSADTLNQSLEKAGRVADFLELGELMCIDALHRRESCGGHFRAESQTEDGEALRHDDEFAYVAAGSSAGETTKGDSMGAPVLHKEDLVYEAIELKQRSYK